MFASIGHIPSVACREANWLACPVREHAPLAETRDGDRALFDVRHQMGSLPAVLITTLSFWWRITYGVRIWLMPTYVLACKIVSLARRIAEAAVVREGMEVMEFVLSVGERGAGDCETLEVPRLWYRRSVVNSPPSRLRLGAGFDADWPLSPDLGQERKERTQFCNDPGFDW